MLVYCSEEVSTWAPQADIRVFLSSYLSSREARVSESTVLDAGNTKGFLDWVTV